jgi:L-alanine-DL-glutamate epimerase-like enolase superfamily enzyme
MASFRRIAAVSSPPRDTDIRICDVEFAYQEYRYRTPLKFGGATVDHVTLLDVSCTVETRTGQRARGLGSMPLGNNWSFPARLLTPDQTLGAMKVLVGRIASLVSTCKDIGHPIDLFLGFERQCEEAAQQVTRELGLAEPIPILCTLVALSPFDAALHDAYGKVHGLNSFQTYGPRFLARDLGAYLGPEFESERLDLYLSPRPRAFLPVYHLVGALDPIEGSDVGKRLDDGLPETLPEWIDYNGLTHLKVKLNGDDLAWDLERIVRIDRITALTQERRRVSDWWYSLDFNECCSSVDYLLEFLRKVEERTPTGFARIQYVEQPTARDLHANRHNDMHEAAKLRPVVIDESLTDLDSLLLARELGYTGVALKACKGQTPSLLLAAAARKYGMFLCVQDLTCPSSSLIQSAGLAAHIPGVAAIEANARQYVPAANHAWETRFPGIFRITDGMMETGTLTGPGLGAALS